jgi:V-type H+-transporting ATPase subunit a
VFVCAGLLVESEPEAAGGGGQAKFTFVTGVIAREKVPAFERILWRACRGNVFLRQTDIEHPLDDPVTGEQVHKVVFILFFQGDQLRTRVRKICEGFRATLYQCPETSGEREQMTVAVSNRIRDLESVLHTTEQHSLTQLQEVALDIDSWQTKVRKMKAIYHAMNMFNLDVTQRCLIAECWCPVKDIPEVQAALARGTERSGATVPSILNRMSTSDQPPTFFRTNKFTSGFQAIVDAYGIATYQEVSPVPYTIITFPFLFAVMFGDAGHGLLMALFAGILILFEKRLANTDVGGEMFSTIFHGRYIVFLMGLFSIYTGMIYNDVFSKSLNLFGSSWNPGYPYGFGDEGQPPAVYNIEDCLGNGGVEIGGGEDHMSEFPTAAMEYRTPYPFGVDPVWQMAENKLVFTNSYKMKMSVIMGVAQMFFGVVLSTFNHVHAKSYISLAVEFVPQVLFLLCIFGWLVLLMVVKWVTFYANPSTAPSLLITLINMFLEFTRLPSDYVVEGRDANENEYSVFGPSAQLATLQAIIQKGLVIAAVASVPVMLLVKPFYLKFQHKKRANSDEEARQTHVAEQVGGEGGEVLHTGAQNGKVGEKTEGHGEGEHFEFGEVFIHQSIHTIEYCLGTISNTASYLRLWALSLAHAELSEVLWMMVLQMGVSMGAEQPALGVAAIFFLFAIWAVLTVGILLIMEGLSAFLHALRLHWVEFQSKFYVGAGYKFVPFSLDKKAMEGET